MVAIPDTIAELESGANKNTLAKVKAKTLFDAFANAS